MSKPRTGPTAAARMAIAVALLAVFTSGGPGTWPPAGELLRRFAGVEPGRSPAAAELPGDFARLDIGLLEGDDVQLGQTFGDDVLPMIRRPEDGSRPRVVTFDAASGRLAHLPALPGDGWLGDATVAATSRFVVVVGLVCTAPTSEGDAGYICSTSDRAEIFVFDRSGERWFHRAPPPDPGPPAPLFTGGYPSVDRIEGTTAQFRNGQDPPPLERLFALSLEPGLPEIPAVASADGPPRCEYADPGMTLSATFEPEHADVVDPDTGTSTRFAVPTSIRTRLRPGFPNDVLCHSAATFLLVRPDPTFRPCVPGLFVAGTEATTTTTTPCPADPTALWVVDLRRPDDPPVRVGDDVTFTGRFGGSPTYWAFEDDDGLHLHRTTDGSDRVVPLRPAPRTAVFLRSAVVVVTSEGMGRLDSISVLAQP